MAPKKQSTVTAKRSDSIKNKLITGSKPATIIPVNSNNISEPNCLTEIQQDSLAQSSSGVLSSNSKSSSSTNPRLFLLYGIIILQLAIFITELITDQFIHSVLILTDAYHHLFNSCNAILLVVCFKISNQMSVKNTFGWVRMEVLGMLTTITFIVALIFSLLIEGALQLLHLHEISGPTNVNVLLIFGIWSLFVNILYVLIINGVVTDKKYKQTTRVERSFSTANCETGCGAGGGVVHSSVEQSFTMKELKDCAKISVSGYSGSTNSSTSSCGDDNNNNKLKKLDKSKSSPAIIDTSATTTATAAVDIRTTTKIEFQTENENDEQFEQQDNCFLGSAVQGLLSPSFLLFGSLVIIMLRSTDFVNMVDPVVGVVTATLLCVTFFPQLKNTMFILMQTVPENVNILRLKKELLNKFGMIQNIHELHIWRLTSSKIVATCHIVLPKQSTSQYRQLFERIKIFLHDSYGITYATIQPEFCNWKDNDGEGRKEPIGENDCFMKCPQQDVAGSECEKLKCCTANEDGQQQLDFSSIGHGHSHGHGHHH